MEFTTSYCPPPHAGTMVNATAALSWSVVGPTVALLGCCVPGVRAPFRLVRVRRTSGYVQRSHMTPSRCRLWQKVIRWNVLFLFEFFDDCRFLAPLDVLDRKELPGFGVSSHLKGLGLVPCCLGFLPFRHLHHPRGVSTMLTCHDAPSR